ncbi:MAG: hypothetical protein ABMA01_21495, partial [Chthoniobacteraceae bacterium]
MKTKILPSPKALLCVIAAISVQSSSASAEEIRLVQEPALSPDGSKLAFAWSGDIWTVPVKGGVAQRLTQHAARESSPSFSPDGRRIAFISERDGSRQVYVMLAGGGEPRRMTWHTEGYHIKEWMPDGGSLLVGINRDFSWMRESRSQRLALLDLTRRRAEEVLFDDYATDGSVSADGRRVLFTREGESWWRQGYRGSRASQIWLFNRDDATFKQIQGEAAECRWPLWKPGGKGFYYISNRDGAFNLWEHDLESGSDRQRTSFKTDSALFPTLSRDGGTLVFRHQFDLYRWRPGDKAAPAKIDIQCASDRVDSPVERQVLDRATGIAFTRDGLQMAFVSGGDVWLMDTELREPRQVTQTAEEERGVVFAPDGKSLWFISDGGGQTDVWKAEPRNPAKFWWENTAFVLSRITDDPDVESRLQFTRNGRSIAYVKGRGDLWLADAAMRNAKRVIGSWDAPSFEFSPDGAWLVYSVRDEWFNNDIWLLPVDGSRAPFNLSRHPNNDDTPVWSPDGKMIAWIGRRESDEVDIYYAWLRAEDDERTKRERTLIKAREKIKKAAAGPSSGTVKASGTKPESPAVAAQPET